MVSFSIILFNRPIVFFINKREVAVFMGRYFLPLMRMKVFPSFNMHCRDNTKTNKQTIPLKNVSPFKCVFITLTKE